MLMNVESALKGVVDPTKLRVSILRGDRLNALCSIGNCIFLPDQCCENKAVTRFSIFM